LALRFGRCQGASIGVFVTGAAGFIGFHLSSRKRARLAKFVAWYRACYGV